MFRPELNLFGFLPVRNSLMFIDAILKSEYDFLSSTLSDERTLLLLLTFSLFSEGKMAQLGCGDFIIFQF